MRPRIRTASLTGYASLCRSLGLDPGELMAGVGLDLADLDTPDRWVPGASAARLLELSARRSGREDVGVRLSELRPLGALGPLSVVIREEPDLRSAVDLLIGYERAYTEVVDLRLVEDGDQATLQVWMDFGEPVPTRQALDLTAAIVVSVVRALVRSDWEPRTACFSHPPPDDLTRFHRAFGPGLRFDQPFTGLVFPVAELAAPVATADASVRPYARQLLATLPGPQPAAATAQVGELVELLLPLGRSSVHEVGRLLGLGPSALRRSLAEEGASFSSVVHTTRARLAERYLANSRYSLTEVSQLLGFAAPSAFSRWFRQRFGVSPMGWRRAAGDVVDPGARTSPSPRTPRGG